MSKPIVFRGGCLCCPGSEGMLAMDTVLYNGFGGYTVERDGELFYMGDPNQKWERFKKLRTIEKVAACDPKHQWRVTLLNPLRGATWERHRGKWHLIDTNMGFA
jgi:hypothetical protein